jgi:hypothetical protein
MYIVSTAAGKLLVAIGCLATYIVFVAVYRLYFSRLAIFPGPKIAGTSSSNVVCK